ncbi:MAG TPA: hypothetical protein VF054_18165 [Micromonosporaceae bacterium]
MPVALSPIIAATAQWLTRAYPAPGGAFSAALAETQARQAVTVAAWLRYPTAIDVELLSLAGPGGAARLDWLTGADTTQRQDDDVAWRTWVDEVVASWAACLLADPALAARAVAATDSCEHAAGLRREFRRLVEPDESDRSAAVLLRHPDLLQPIAELHRADLLALLQADLADAA